MGAVSFEDRVAGCLLGGAVGDALGALVEFKSWSEIEALYGPSGVTTIEPPGHFTDDTQMTLFTAEGLIRALRRFDSKGICHPPSVVRHAYLRWLHTQGYPWYQVRNTFDWVEEPDGWLVAERRLHIRRAPGHTCISALGNGGDGTTDEPINDSVGCGGVMRAAPVGLVMPHPDGAYALGCETAALTHGNPDGGWHPAGCLAAMVSSLIAGDDLRAAVGSAIELTSPHMAEVLSNAVRVADSGVPTPELIEGHLGAGWHGDEALGIAVACALASPDFPTGVIAAANHSGDTDSTASICGNLLGAAFGIDAVPAEWLDALDGRDIVAAMAVDIVRQKTDPPGDEWDTRYPPY